MSLRDYLLDSARRGCLLYTNYFGSLAKNCGLLMGVTDGVTDQVGKTTRLAVQGQAIVGDGSTYISLALQNLGNTHTIEFTFTTPTLFSPIIGRSSTNEGIFITGTSKIRYRGSDGVSHDFGISLNIGEKYNIKLIRESSLLTLLINDIFYASKVIPTNVTLSYEYLFWYLTSNKYIGILELFKINNYTLNTIPDSGVYQLIPVDGSEPILCQQYLAPAIPTVINIDVVSMQDALGYTEQSGAVQYYKDQALTLPFTVGTLIPNYPDGMTSTGYVDGAHPQGQYLGRAKYNFINNGTTLTLADNYNEVFKADTTGILHTAGVPKVLTIVTVPNIANNQFFFDSNGKMLFFENSLLEDSDCMIKALKHMKFGEPLTDVNGDPLYDIDGKLIYVYKDGIVIV